MWFASLAESIWLQRHRKWLWLALTIVTSSSRHCDVSARVTAARRWPSRAGGRQRDGESSADQLHGTRPAPAEAVAEPAETTSEADRPSVDKLQATGGTEPQVASDHERTGLCSRLCSLDMKCLSAGKPYHNKKHNNKLVNY